MGLLEGCAGLAPGVPVLGCLNELANYYPAIGVMFLVFFILLANLSFEPVRVRVGASLFVTFVVGSLLGVLGWLPDTVLAPFIVMLIASVAVLWVEKD